MNYPDLMGRKSLKEKRKKEIIEVFYHLAVEEGLENTSIAKIASEMDCNPSLIVHYFESKEELIYHLVDYMLERYATFHVFDSDKISSKNDFMETIDRLFSNDYIKRADDGVYFSCYSLASTYKIIRKKFWKSHQEQKEKLLDLFKYGKEKGYLKTKNLKMKTGLFLVILDGIHLQTAFISDLEGQKGEINDFKKHAFALLEL